MSESENWYPPSLSNYKPQLNPYILSPGNMEIYRKQIRIITQGGDPFGALVDHQPRTYSFKYPDHIPMKDMKTSFLEELKTLANNTDYKKENKSSKTTYFKNVCKSFLQNRFLYGDKNYAFDVSIKRWAFKFKLLTVDVTEVPENLIVALQHIVITVIPEQYQRLVQCRCINPSIMFIIGEEEEKEDVEMEGENGSPPVSQCNIVSV